MRRSSGIAAVLAVVSCSEAEAPSPEPEVSIVAGAPRPGDAEATGALELGALLAAPSTIEVIGATSAGELVVSAGGRIYEVLAGAPEPRALYAEGGDPTALGAVHRITPRAGGRAWLAAEAGLFELLPHYVTRVYEDVGAVHDLAELAGGPMAGLWLATSGGLLRREDAGGTPGAEGGVWSRWELPNLDGAPEELAFDASAGALVRSGPELALLEAEGGTISSDRPPLDSGDVYALAAGGGALYAGTARGLYRFDPSRTPRWTRFTLAGEAAAAVPVLAVIVDPTSGVAWARTPSALVRADGDDLSTFALPQLDPAATPRPRLAIDARGEVYATRGEVLDRVSSQPGASATFTVDVLPWISARCSPCHRNQTQDFEDYAVFAPKAEAALSRVRSGDMPRCSGSLICPTEQRLSAEDYAVLERWIRAGKPE